MSCHGLVLFGTPKSRYCPLLEGRNGSGGQKWLFFSYSWPWRPLETKSWSLLSEHKLHGTHVKTSEALVPINRAVTAISSPYSRYFGNIVMGQKSLKSHFSSFYVQTRRLLYRTYLRQSLHLVLLKKCLVMCWCCSVPQKAASVRYLREETVLGGKSDCFSHILGLEAARDKTMAPSFWTKVTWDTCKHFRSVGSYK